MKSRKVRYFLIILSILVVVFILIFFLLREKRFFNPQHSTQEIVINDNGIDYLVLTNASSVDGLLQEEGIEIGENDLLYQDKNSKIFSGMEIRIDRSQKIDIEVDGREIEAFTRANTINEVLKENQITLSRLDKISPELLAPPLEDEKIKITRINEEEKVVQEEIDFKTSTKTSSKLGWREEKIEQKGENGILEVKYKIIYQDGQEISRVALEKNIVKDPVTEIVTQGTYIDLGKSHTGQGTWYAQPDWIQDAYPSITGYYAANPWLEKGSYAKVTNKDNEKSIIVIINDRGPFGEGRIIDLDKKAFAAIASIGAGVINVKVEEIKN